MIDVIQQRLSNYNANSLEDEENALKEISQEVILYALSEAGFFEHAAFLGGTCLRINHGLDRFSEDLDFSLKMANGEFKISDYLDEVIRVMNVYGYDIELSGSDKANDSVQSRFLKDDSLKKLLNFKHKQDIRRKIQIKFEVDINPPEGANIVADYLSFPTQFMIMTYDLPSLMAGKVHALLCRPYTKGRDWYDFLWYAGQKIQINTVLLNNALEQMGPWKDQSIQISDDWIHEQLLLKVKSIDWNAAKHDVEKFLKPEKQKALSLWSEDFFVRMTNKLFE